MLEPVSKVFGIIFACLLMFYFITYQNYDKLEDYTYNNTRETVTEFVDNVRMKGYITPSMYEDFVQKLHTGSEVLFNIEMTHKKKIYVPVYTDPTDISSFTGEYRVENSEYYWDQIKETLYDSSVPYDERIYKLEVGDSFSIYVENKTKFKSTMLLDMILGPVDVNDVPIRFPYGGMVLNQDWTNGV